MGGEEHIVFPPFTLDTLNKCLWRNSQKKIKLRPRSFALLTFLVEHPHRILSKEELLWAVWGHSHVVEAVLKVTVSEIRHALGDSAESPKFVETTERGGYRFIAPVGTKVSNGQPVQENWRVNVENWGALEQDGSNGKNAPQSKFLYEEDIETLTPELARRFGRVHVHNPVVRYLLKSAQGAAHRGDHRAAFDNIAKAVAILRSHYPTVRRKELELRIARLMGISSASSRYVFDMRIKDALPRARHLSWTQAGALVFLETMAAL